jgi:hypothetical protein
MKMAAKTCPNCDRVAHVRTKSCPCGFDFLLAVPQPELEARVAAGRRAKERAHGGDINWSIFDQNLLTSGSL